VVQAAGSTTFAELVAEPATGRVHAESARGGLADATPSGRVRLDAMARWLQDVAYGDVEDSGTAAAGFWIVRRTRLRVERFPAFREPVELRTWCSGVGRVWAERRTSLRGASGAHAEAVALWVFVDPETARPQSLAGIVGGGYEDAARGRRVSARLHQAPEPPAGAVRMPWRFRAAELDLAGHVNNTAAWAAVEEVLAKGPEPADADAEVEYRAPAAAGRGALLRDGGALWLLAPDGEVHATAVLQRASG
jgi:acyl-ACP thioesterase